MNKIILENKITTISELMEILLAIFINLAANDCECEGTTKELTCKMF